MQCPRYDEIIKGTYNEVFVSFKPALRETVKNEINDLFTHDGSVIVDPWSDHKLENGEHFNCVSFEINAKLQQPIPYYGRKIFMLLKKRKMNNTRFTISDWRKYVGHDDEPDPTQEEIKQHFESQRR